MKRIALIGLLALGLGAGAGALRPRRALYDGLSFSRAVYDRDGKLLRLTLSRDGKYRLWLPLGEISPLLIEATMLHEDRHFRRHPGADPAALARSAWSSYGSGKRRMGGSTITMQLARLRWGVDSRTVLGKLVQIARAFELELLYSKDEILEAYLNAVPYGSNIEGVGAASLIYFSKNADQLTLSEALTLAVIPQNPVRRTLTGGHRSDQGARERARSRLYARWVARKPEALAEAYSIGSAELARARLPFEAPHLSEKLLARRNDGRLITTLSRKKQSLLERVLRRYVERKRRVGVRNASAILIDWRSMEVLGLIGSADYFDAAIAGQVDGTAAPRSPGSALKPFVYGLAFDQGLIHHDSLLFDAPSSFGAFNPENFDGDFAGPIKAREALVKSRNIPAVWLGSKLKGDGLHALLGEAGVALPKPASHYGLGIALGTAEVSAEQLAMLYAALPAGGLARPLRWTQSDPSSSGRRILSRDASFMVMEALKTNPRPGKGLRTNSPEVPVFWKTGTSYAFRDAWSAGVFGPYALVVWVGEFDGSGNPSFVGLEAAAPLFFEIVDALAAEERLEDEHARGLHGLSVVKVESCAVSGALPGPSCPRRALSWFIPGVSPIASCEVHRELLVDPASGLRLCRARDGAKTQIHEFWPSDLSRLFAKAGLPRRPPPPFEPGCEPEAVSPGRSPQIGSPLEGVSYLVRPGAGETVALDASADADARRLYWFVDRALVGRSEPGRALWWPARPGRFTVRVVDERGRSDSRELRVTVQ